MIVVLSSTVVDDAVDDMPDQIGLEGVGVDLIRCIHAAQVSPSASHAGSVSEGSPETEKFSFRVFFLKKMQQSTLESIPPACGYTGESQQNSLIQFFVSRTDL